MDLFFEDPQYQANRQEDSPCSRQYRIHSRWYHRSWNELCTDAEPFWYTKMSSHCTSCDHLSAEVNYYRSKAESEAEQRATADEHINRLTSIIVSLRSEIDSLRNRQRRSREEEEADIYWPRPHFRSDHTDQQRQMPPQQNMYRSPPRTRSPPRQLSPPPLNQSGPEDVFLIDGRYYKESELYHTKIFKMARSVNHKWCRYQAKGTCRYGKICKDAHKRDLNETPMMPSFLDI